MPTISFAQVLGRTCTKLDMLEVTAAVIRQPQRIAELWSFAISDSRHAWRGMWALSHVNQHCRSLLSPYLGQIQAMVVASTNHSQIREMLKILHLHPLGDSPSGELLDACFRIVSSSAYPVGVRMYAMDMVAKFCEVYPEVAPEFYAILEEVVAEPPSVGTRKWAQRLISELEKGLGALGGR